MINKDHKLAAIVFTDIVGYTKQMEKNEELTMQLLQKQREIIFPIVESHGGEIIKEIGDGLLMMFNSAIEAVRCTINIQARLKEEELTIRAGIHIGDVIFKDGDVFGSAVNTAARIEPLAPPNGICISEDVRNQVKNKDDIRTVSIGEKNLKGVGDTVEVFRVALGNTNEESSEKRIPFLKDLWQRRVIQILVLYIITAVLIRFVVSTVVTNLVLSPHLVSLTWIILLSLIPTVGLIAYFHGKSKEKWNKIETIGLPLNLLFTIMLV
ncbi:MAG: adenylate/guanylate cyclase domain-containing protein, partial [Bacteroidales bacterium]|nr:adenylate/guanylate cyclase domain-containing protein [Bacteroidales bacterium]